MSSRGRDLRVTFCLVGEYGIVWFSILLWWFTLGRGVAFNCYSSTSPAARGWSGLYLCLGRYTPSARGAWSVVGRCVDCGMRRRGRSAAVERVDPPVGSLFRVVAGALAGGVLLRIHGIQRGRMVPLFLYVPRDGGGAERLGLSKPTTRHGH